MKNLKSLAESRIRNQISNMILFGSMIAVTAFGLVLGMLSGVTLLSHTALQALPPIFKLVTILTFTISGFSFGVFLSLFISPLILRFAFFAKRIGNWNGVDVYSAADADLPGKTANVFISGFSFGYGPFKPTIFVAEGAAQILSRSALEAVFAHELSHLQCQHLLKRTFRGIGAFLLASVFTAITLVGLQWSGYAELGGFFSLISGVIPAVLTWLTIRKMAWSQEIEADSHALKHFEIAPESLIEALRTLQGAAVRVSGADIHPLVAERLTLLQAKCLPTASAVERAA